MTANKREEQPKRKSLRLKSYDYSSAGAYFVTVCTKDRGQILSRIVLPAKTPTDTEREPAQQPYHMPQIQLTEIGKTVEKNLLSSKKISGVKVDRYVIMPDHVHVIFVFLSDKYAKGGIPASSRVVGAPTPTGKNKNKSDPANAMLPKVISAFKRFCDKETGLRLFERGYYEHIIRDKEDYEAKVRYICENPMRRLCKERNT